MEWWSSKLGKSAIWMKMTLVYLIVANMSPNIPNTMPQKSSFSLLNFLTYNSCHPFAPAGPPCALSFWHSYSLLSTQHITINACIMKSLLNIIGTVSKWLAAFTLFQSLLPSSYCWCAYNQDCSLASNQSGILRVHCIYTCGAIILQILSFLTPSDSVYLSIYMCNIH